MNILGISAFYHDAAACLIQNGQIVAAAQEERFSRKKHDASFPLESMQYCLRKGKVGLSDLDALVFYDKPLLTFDRLLATYLSFAPKGLRSFLRTMPLWLNEKIFLRKILEKNVQKFLARPDDPIPLLLFSEHHQSHAASAFFPSGFDQAAVLCLDGVGEWVTTSAWIGEGNRLTPLWEIRFPHSVGLLYSSFTSYLGFKVNSGESKVMGLAPYGRPVFVQKILDHLIDLKSDGSFRLNLDYFDFCTGLEMTNTRFHQLFGASPRLPESKLTQKEMDIACSIQKVAEEIIFRLTRTLIQQTGQKNLCMAGGVALNCVANGKILSEKLVDNVWIQPAAGDAGGALGAAYAAYHQYFDQPRRPVTQKDLMQGAFLGPDFSLADIGNFLKSKNVPFKQLEGQTLYPIVAKAIAEGKVVGWFSGRMEFGPRALGARSLLGDARSSNMQDRINRDVKNRESFRPFAPSVLAEKAKEYFDLAIPSPYMLLTALVKTDRQIKEEIVPAVEGLDKLSMRRSDIPSATHVDYSARIQTVSLEDHPQYYRLLKEFERQTGCAVIINTSFNVRGEPIVCTPEDAYRCFLDTNIDLLVIENYVLDRGELALRKSQNFREWKFNLD